jgi:hypothetical protein
LIVNIRGILPCLFQNIVPFKDEGFVFGKIADAEPFPDLNLGLVGIGTFIHLQEVREGAVLVDASQRIETAETRTKAVYGAAAFGT